MSHPDFNAIAAFLEGRLAPAEQAVLVQHLAECSECRGTLALYGRAAAGQPEATALASGPGAKPRVLRLWLPLAASLAIATGAVMLVAWWPETARVPVAADRPAPAGASSAAQAPLPDAAPPVAEEPSPTPRALPPPGRSAPITEGLLARRSGTVQVEGKVFRLEAGDWVDAAYDPTALLPVVRARTTEERESLLSRMPALAPYAALGPRVTVVVDGTVYRFELPAS